MASLKEILRQAGFKGQGLNTAYAVAMAESGGRWQAHNPDASTGDNSYGAFQINMLGNLGPSRRKQFGLQSNDQLYDPLTNAKAAFRISSGGTNWKPWTTFTSGKYKQYLGGSGGGSEVAPLPVKGGFKIPKFDLGGAGPGIAAPGPVSGGFKLPDFDLSGPGIEGPSLPSAQFELTPLSPGGPKATAPITEVMPSDNIGAQAVKKAATQLGDPYHFGASSAGADPSSFDCSSLVQWTYRQLGINIPRDTRGQQAVLKQKAWKDLQPGDPIYRRSGGHVVIYAGNGRVIAAPHTGTDVQYQPLSWFPQDSYVPYKIPH